jgi:hypothetical protein
LLGEDRRGGCGGICLEAGRKIQAYISDEQSTPERSLSLSGAKEQPNYQDELHQIGCRVVVQLTSEADKKTGLVMKIAKKFDEHVLE